MDTLNTLVPPKTEVTALGSARTIKPFTIKQTVQLVRLINGVKEKISASLKSKNLATSDILLEIVGNLNTEQIVNLAEILLNTQLNATEKQLAENISMEELSEILKAVAKVNDFKKIFANFTTAMEQVNKTA